MTQGNPRDRDRDTVDAVSTPDIQLDETTAPPPTATDPYIGKTIDGRYLVEEVLGQGGMGVVYRGRHKLIDKKVAIKVLRGELARNKEVTDRFLQEARAASAIGNPHIIDISDFGVLPDGATYFVMEHLAGISLSSVTEEGKPVPVPRIVAIGKQIAQGLSAAHAAGIIHRDLKPDNVMLVTRGTDKDFVKILDFGIAKVQTGDASRLTRAGQVFGTPHYMSPEQAAGATVTHATDIYSLGVMLYEMAAGKVPFDAENFMGILTMHMYKAPVPMRALIPAPQEIPPGLDAIVLKCLSKKAEQRYPSMDALVDDLDKLEKGQLPGAVTEMMARSGGFNVPADYFRSSKMPPPMPAEPAGRARRRSKIPLIAAVAAIVTVTAIAVGVLVRAKTTNADSQETATAETAAPPPKTAVPPPSTAPTETAATTAGAAAEKRAIAIATVPVDAKISLGGKELKSPVVLQLAEGEKQTLTVSRAGYVTQRVEVTGADGNRTIKLAPVAGGRPAHGGHASPGSTSVGMGLGPDPFGDNPKH
jgi:tRNA A-37 threonylcarbamoyl transferase component Bud32